MNNRATEQKEKRALPEFTEAEGLSAGVNIDFGPHKSIFTSNLQPVNNSLTALGDNGY
jgi:hypothetical protein